MHYRDILNRIRLAFPQPVSDRVHDSYVVHTVMRALDMVDALKGDLPILGAGGALDYAVARAARLAEEGASLEEVTAALVGYLEGMTVWGHPRTQQNVVPPPSIASLVGTVLAGLCNPNLASEEHSHRFALAEVEAAAMTAALVEEFRLPYRPHVHADAVIGWAWSVFNDYPFDGNPLGFRPRTVRALAGACHRIRHLGLADSVGVDFHKTGFTPYISSLALFRDGDDLRLLGRSPEQMPYLYHSGEHRPGMYTLETSRSGVGVLAALANLKLFGRQGWQAILGHIVEMAQLLREHLEGHASTTVLNRDNFGTVTLFRAYPDGVDTFEIKDQEMTDPAFREVLLRHNDYNRRIADYVHDEAMAGRGVVISLTECYRRTTYGEPVAALKSYILSPFADEENVEAVVAKVLEAREKIGA